MICVDSVKTQTTTQWLYYKEKEGSTQEKSQFWIQNRFKNLLFHHENFSFFLSPSSYPLCITWATIRQFLFWKTVSFSRAPGEEVAWHHHHCAAHHHILTCFVKSLSELLKVYFLSSVLSNIIPVKFKSISFLSCTTFILCSLSLPSTPRALEGFWDLYRPGASFLIFFHLLSSFVKWIEKSLHLSWWWQPFPLSFSPVWNFLLELGLSWCHTPCITVRRSKS